MNRNYILKKCIMTVSFLFLLTCDTARPATFDPTENYEVRQVEGWTVRINKRLLADPELSGQVLALLSDQLRHIIRVVPDEPLAALRKVNLWMELDLTNGGAVYHPSAQWLREHDVNPDKAGCVEVSNARHFIGWYRDQPCMVLHELAHAYHHQVLGHDHAGLKAAYEKAKASKKYESVLHISGRRQVHYAMNNVQEYFAEMTEAFLGTNDFYPFVRAELKDADPEMFALMEGVWKTKKHP